MIELWDVYNRNREKTGRIIERGQEMTQDEYHLVVNAWLQNKEGKYLISQRTPNKSYPLMWEATGGSALSGESSLEAALREVREELGIELDPSCGRLVASGIRQYDTFPDFLDVWIFFCDYPVEKVQLQEGETCGAKWASAEEIWDMVCKGEWIPMEKFNYLKKLGI